MALVVIEHLTIKELYDNLPFGYAAHPILNHCRSYRDIDIREKLRITYDIFLSNIAESLSELFIR